MRSAGRVDAGGSEVRGYGVGMCRESSTGLRPAGFVAFGLLAGAAGALGAVTGVGAQETVIAETCGEPWRIEAEHELRLGGPDDPGRIQNTVARAVDSRDRLILWPYGATGHVFDATGRFLTSIGGEGQGPGEFSQRVRALRVGAQDTLYVFDAGNMRVSIYDDDYGLVETRSLSVAPSLNGVVRLTSGRWVFNAHVATPERIGFPLHVLEDGGEIVESFGALTPVYRSDVAHSGDRALTPAPGDRVWASWLTEYRVELWETDNRRVRSLVREARWFRPWVRNVWPFDPDEPRHPYVLGIHLDAQGVLWVVIWRTADDFRDYVIEFAPGQYTIEEPAYRYYQAVVEAIDVDRACVLARLEPEPHLSHALGDRRYLAYHESPEGIPYLDVWRLDLVR